MRQPFEDFDLSGFWDNSEYARKEYVGEPLSSELISSVEKELGYTLPESYLELMKTQNGGIPRNTCFPTQVPTYYAKDHVCISGIFGVGREKTYALCGRLGAKFFRDRWMYPSWGISIGNCPSAGHDMIMLDYRNSGPVGEPEVVHVCQETGYNVTYLALNFEDFIRGLVNDSVYDKSDERLRSHLKTIDRGSFSSLLSGLIAASGEPDYYSRRLRDICRKLTVQKGFFALHADDLSYLVYDLLFYLFTLSKRVADKEEYVTIYPAMIAFGDGTFTIGGYGKKFIENWLDKRLLAGQIVRRSSGELTFGEPFLSEFEKRLKDVK